jgi:hypothetical protein
VRVGQVNRRVFGTLANKESSRSHAVLEVRVERTRIDVSSVVVDYLTPANSSQAEF